MSITDLLILSLATFRFSLMVSKEDGPAWIFRKLRKLPPAKSSAKEGLSCQWCMSVWSGAIMLTLWYHGGEAFVYFWAICGGAVCLNQQFTKSR